MINYVLVGLILTLSLLTVIVSERKCAREVRQARWQGMREGVNMTGLTMIQVSRQVGELSEIDIDSVASKVHTLVELEEWADR